MLPKPRLLPPQPPAPNIHSKTILPEGSPLSPESSSFWKLVPVVTPPMCVWGPPTQPHLLRKRKPEQITQHMLLTFQGAALSSSTWDPFCFLSIFIYLFDLMLFVCVNMSEDQVEREFSIK